MPSVLTERKQYTSVKGNNLKSQEITHGVPQGSVLILLPYIIFINDLNLSVTLSNAHHFASDTNLPFIENKFLNNDLALLVQWLRAYNISLNTNKTEIVNFTPKHKTIIINLQISDQK